MVDLPEGAVLVAGFPDYAVDREGGVWRVTPPLTGPRIADAVPYRLKPLMMGGKGHRSAHVKLRWNGAPVAIARLVLGAFAYWPLSDKPRVKYIDGDGGNPALSNLRWIGEPLTPAASSGNPPVRQRPVSLPHVGARRGRRGFLPASPCRGRPMSPLEKLGLEVAAERLLGGRGQAKLLCCLIDGAGASVSSETLWAASSQRFECIDRVAAVKIRMCWLRAALDDVGLGGLIVNHKGHGYALPDPGRTTVLDRLVEEAGT